MPEWVSSKRPDLPRIRKDSAYKASRKNRLGNSNWAFVYLIDRLHLEVITGN
jgi:hypothetical protein